MVRFEPYIDLESFICESSELTAVKSFIFCIFIIGNGFENVCVTSDKCQFSQHNILLSVTFSLDSLFRISFGIFLSISLTFFRNQSCFHDFSEDRLR